MKEKKQGEASQAGLRPHTQAALKRGPGASPALTPEGQGDACSVPEAPRPPTPLPFISAIFQYEAMFAIGGRENKKILRPMIYV